MNFIRSRRVSLDRENLFVKISR